MARIKLHKKIENLCIGGSMDLMQRENSFPSIANGTFTSDRLAYFKSAGVTAINDCNIVADAPTTEKELTYSNKISVTTAQASMAASDFIKKQTRIIGYDYSKLVGNNIVISFWVKAVKTGVSCVSIQNADATRSYVAEYTINASNVLERKVIKLKADNIGTWLTDNNIGMKLIFPLASGTNFHGTTGWQSGDFIATSNCVNHVDNIANTFQITGIMVHTGIEETTYFVRAGITYNKELEKSKWYYERRNYGTDGVIAEGTIHNSANIRSIIHFNEKRVIPTITSSFGSGGNGWGFVNLASTTALNTVTPTFALNTKTTSMMNCVTTANEAGGNDAGGYFQMNTTGNGIMEIDSEL